MSGIDDILAGYESLRAGQEALYQDLHQHPKLSHAEHRAARPAFNSRRWWAPSR